MIRITWKHLAALLAGLVAAGLALGWSGLISIAASSGHWWISNQFLHWVMQNAVRTQSTLTVSAPAIDDGPMVAAAGHFAAACSNCHGAPGEAPSPLMRAATPHAPSLYEREPDYTDKELFWILQHGIKYTGMPAWPAQGRKDEVRRMVRFVRSMPHLTTAQYRRLAYNDIGVVTSSAVTMETALPDCMRCHGADGRGRGQPDIPNLAGQDAAYIKAALDAYASGRRGSGIMQTAAARVDDGTRVALARHYAALPAPPSAAPAAAPIAERIVREGIPRLDLPACASCHGGGPRRVAYPRLEGQKASYLAAQLHLWREDARGHGRSNDLMANIAKRIPKSQIEPLAAWYAAQPRR